jgi:hypothetical protein
MTTQLPLLLPAAAPYMSLERATAEIDWLWGRGPHPDDVAEREARLEAARELAKAHRRGVRALWGGR